MIDKLFIVLLAGLPFGHFLFKGLDLWTAQGHFFQVGLLMIFCCSLITKPRCVQILNKPLALLTLWIGLTTAYLWVRSISTTQHYAIKIFFPFFNWLCFILFYKLALEYLNENKIKEILKWLRYSFIIIMFYCVLQFLRLDEFLVGYSNHDELVGTIGNTSHLAGLLAIIQPLFFDRKYTLHLILLWLIILCCNSASGIFVGLGIILFRLALDRKWKLFITIFALLKIGLIILLFKFPLFLSTSHRLEVWSEVFKTCKDKFITGLGMGSFGMLNFQLGGKWLQLHNEYYQVVFELGIIGFILLLWCLCDYFRDGLELRTNKTSVIFLSMLFGLCLLSFVSFPVHLWQFSALGMLAYSGIYVLKNNLEPQVLGV